MLYTHKNLIKTLRSFIFLQQIDTLPALLIKVGLLMTPFEQKIVDYCLKKISEKDFEQWIYEHPEVEEEIGSSIYIELLSSDFSDSKIIEILNPWFITRFPNALADLRTMRSGTSSKKFEAHFLRSLE